MMLAQKPIARRSGFFSDVGTVARRAIRSLLREPEFIGPALAIPIFFFVVNIGALETFVERQAGIDYRAFQLPVGIVFAVTGISRANMLVTDIQTGYLDRMLVTPIRRVSLLLGLMIADIVLALVLATVVLLLGFAVGVSFGTGVAGLGVFVVLAMAWSLAFTGFPYTVALRTGNPAAVNSAFLIFFPFAFLTPSMLPRELMSGWLKTVAAWNPVTYLLEGMRSVLSDGWDLGALVKAAAAILGLAVVTFTMAFRSLARRVATG
ncbi:MAG: ABC transporter permease [Actinomycetota bacterium]|jgi:ABC-2 type transport system permease protein|nr:ABC transporter permease [Actinomycetota bacterium]|tara:strand:+ start:14369 stop:15160 length:792 start_codon:yes stop_codon:yes gene_type:complete